MSAAPSVAAATLVQADVAVRSAAAEPAPESTGLATPARSFTEILSAQRGASPHDDEVQRDADNKAGGKADGKADSQSEHAPESKSASAKASGPSSQSDPAQAPLVPSAGSLPSPRAAASSLPAAGDSPSHATHASVIGSTVQEGEVAAGSERSGLPSVAGPAASEGESDVVMAAATAEEVPTAASGERAAPGRSAEAAASSTEALPSAASAHLATALSAAAGAHTPATPATAGATTVAGPAAAGADTAAGTDAAATTSAAAPSLPLAESAAPGFAASRSLLPTGTGSSVHGGAAAASGAATARSSSTQATPSTGSGSGSAASASPLPRMVAESQPAQAGASLTPRVAESPIHAGGAAAPSNVSIAQQVASSVDVDDLAGSISRPLSDGNGTYTVTVALHPAELGHVQAVMSLGGNDLQVSLTAQTQAGHDALSNTADALRDQLARGGVNVNVNVTLRDPGSQAGGDERYRPPAAPGATGSFGAESAATEAPLSSGLVSSQIHLVL